MTHGFRLSGSRAKKKTDDTSKCRSRFPFVPAHCMADLGFRGWKQSRQTSEGAPGQGEWRMEGPGPRHGINVRYQTLKVYQGCSIWVLRLRYKVAKPVPEGYRENTTRVL